jgi:hypothetical protein
MFKVFTELKTVHHDGQKLWKWSVELRPEKSLPAELNHERSGIAKSLNDAQLSMMVAVGQMETQAKSLGFKFPEE